MLRDDFETGKDFSLESAGLLYADLQFVFCKSKQRQNKEFS